MVRLSIFLLYLIPAIIIANSGSIYNELTIKNGTINQNESWSGKIILTGDVTIPNGVTVTVMPDTWLVFQTQDHTPVGKNDNKVEIIALGNLIKSDNSIKLMTTQSPLFRNFLNRYEQLDIPIIAQPVSTQKIESKWRSYKHQYAIIWAIMYSLAIIL